jgi:hypothetical protein
MAKEDAALNGGLESRMMESKKRREIWKQCTHVFLLSWSVWRDGRFYLSWLIIVVFDFRCANCANDCTVASNVSLVGIDSIRD